MRQLRHCLIGVLTVFTATAYALPQTLGERAYPLERYIAADYNRYNPQTLFDILSRLPGITLGQNSNGQEDIQLHGLDNRYILLLINGQPIRGTSVNNSLSSKQIPASLVASIEIDRNSRGDLYAGGGSTGTINVLLHDVHSNAHITINAGGLDFSHQESAAVKWNNHDHAVRLALQNSNIKENLTGKSSANGTILPFEKDSRTEAQSLLLNYHNFFHHNPVRFYLLYLTEIQKNHIDGYSIFNTISSEANINSDIQQNYKANHSSTRFGGDINFESNNKEIAVDFLVERFNQDNNYNLVLPINLSQNQYINDNRWHIGWKIKELENEHKWQLGLGLQTLNRSITTDNQHILSINNDRTILPFEFSYNEFKTSVFLLDRWQITPYTLFEFGFHLDNYWIKKHNRISNISHASNNNAYWLPSFHLMHQISGRSKIRISANQTLRLPDIADVIPYEFQDVNRVWRGNEDLNAEVMSSFDLGYEHNFRLRNSSLSDKNSGFYLRAYKRIIRDPITLNINQEPVNGQSATVFQPINSDDYAHSHGIEMDIALTMWPGSKLDIGGGLYYSKLKRSQSLPSDRIPNQPDHMLKLGLDQTFSFWNIGFLWRNQGESLQYLPSTSGYVIQEQSQLDQFDIYAGYTAISWNVNMMFSISSDPNIQWEQDDQQQWINQNWLIRLTARAIF